MNISRPLLSVGGILVLGAAIGCWMMEPSTSQRLPEERERRQVSRAMKNESHQSGPSPVQESEMLHAGQSITIRRSSSLSRDGALIQDSTEQQGGELTSYDHREPVILYAGYPVSERLKNMKENLEFLSPGEQKIVAKINEDFSDAVEAVESESVGEEAYFDHWRSSLDVADERLRAALGWERFNRLSSLAAQAASLEIK